MEPCLCIRNIFGADARRIADFAFQYGFAGIDWIPEPREQEPDFLARMEDLAGLEVHLHCAFSDADMACSGEEGARALDFHRQWVERAAMAGIRQMTVRLGAASGPNGGSFQDGAGNLKRLVQAAAGMGVTVSLMNLASPFSGDPFVFSALVAASGCSVAVDIDGIAALREQWPAVSCRDYVTTSRRQVTGIHVGSPYVSSAGVLAEGFGLLLQIPGCRWWVLDAPTPRELLRLRDAVEERLARLVPSLSLELLLAPLAGQLQTA
jgi:hypothetical protein